ncbi:MAG: hypothetical protein AB4063_11780 [Crocosphaera sp.]
MKFTAICIDTIIIACFLMGVGATFDKIDSTSISNPFKIRTAQLHQTK